MRAPALSFCSNVFPGSTPQCEKQPGGGTAIFPRAQWGCRGSNNYQRLKKISFRSNCNKGNSGCGCGGGSDCGGGLSSIVTREVFEEMLPYRNDPRCPAAGFYTYDALMEAAKAYPAFAATGDDATRKREVAAFFGQTSHETSGGVGWNAPGGPYVWGYCFTKQINPPSDYLDKTCKEYPCVPGQKYYGRGPIQLTCKELQLWSIWSNHWDGKEVVRKPRPDSKRCHIVFPICIVVLDDSARVKAFLPRCDHWSVDAFR
ncbi:endochitinase 1 isoform X2 [Gossypium hirsutum]|uniref:chitinase n=1 Tax=Gossypium hirsutum TaxID=3635 RepID=A0ABM3AWG2_GOSHI|nr:endochitinase 1 isoform X2 [Gossypium hirsutum]